MIRHHLLLIGFFVGGCVSDAASAQDAAGLPGNPEAVFKALVPSRTPRPQIYLGRAVAPGKYPALFHGKNGGGYCSATLVSSRVVLTAAHCLGGAVTIALKQSIGFSEETYRGSCYPDTEEPGKQLADVVICVLENTPPVTEFESVDLDLKWVAHGAEIRLIGFGCVTRDMRGGNDGQLTEGETHIDHVSVGDNATATTLGGVALCEGDSGGPAFTSLNGKRYDERRIVSVSNSTFSHTVAGKNYIDKHLISKVTLLGAEPSRTYLKTWLSQHTNEIICGVSVEAGTHGCHL